MPNRPPTNAERQRKAMPPRKSSTQRGYNYRWQQYAKHYLIEHPMCACGCGRPAEHVDHIKAVRGPGDPRFWDPTNHQGLTAECHSRKTAQEDGGFGRDPVGGAISGGLRP